MANISESTSVQEAIKLADKIIANAFIIKPSKPSKLSFDDTAVQMKMYAEKLEEYESKIEDYKVKLEGYNKIKSKTYLEVEEFIKEDSGLNNSYVPEKYRDKIYSYAYAEGHSSGYSNIHSILCDLVKIFE